MTELEIKHISYNSKIVWECINPKCKCELTEYFPLVGATYIHTCLQCRKKYEVENRENKIIVKIDLSVEEKTQLDYIEKYQIPYLYHFTHLDNLDQILNKGLLSKNKLKEQELKYVSIADGEVQRIRRDVKFHLLDEIEKPIHDCVPLYMSCRTPTLYKVLHEEGFRPQDIVYIFVKTRSILSKNFCFTDGNAASNSTQSYVLIDDLDKLDWEVIRNDGWGGDKEKKRKKNAEFLVYPEIEVKDFFKFAVFDAPTKKVVDNLLNKKGLSIDVAIDTKYYEWPKL